MTTLPQASTYNVEASINAWMQAALQAFSLPVWMSPLPAVVFDAPQVSASIPCFALTHIPVGVANPFQGRWAGTSRGGKASGILDVSCYVSRSKSRDWVRQLRTMRDMVLSTAEASPVVVIADYAALPRNTVAPAIATTALTTVALSGDDGTWSNTPASTEYKANINDVTIAVTQADPNPDVERVRVLVDYSYIIRASV